MGWPRSPASPHYVFGRSARAHPPLRAAAVLRWPTGQAPAPRCLKRAKEWRDRLSSSSAYIVAVRERHRSARQVKAMKW